MAGLRWTRAVLFAAVATTTGSLAHVGAEGRLPGALALCGLGLAMVVACAAVLRPSPSAGRVVLLLVAGQSFVHLALTALAGHRQTEVLPMEGPHEDHHASGVSGLDHLTVELTGPEAPMVLTHLAAAVAVGVWLAYGEAAVFAVIGLAAARIRLALNVEAPLVAVPLATAVRVELPACRLHSVFAARALGRRGPPARLLVTA